MGPRVHGLAGAGWTGESESTSKDFPVEPESGDLVLKLGSSSIGLASPQVPASPRKVSPQVQKVGLLSALMYINL